MDEISRAVENIIENSQRQSEKDYMQDGILYCGNCHRPKQMKLKIMGKDRIVGIMCKCEIEKAAEDDKYLKANSIRMQCIDSKEYRSYRFDKDDNSNKSISKACRNYVIKCHEMKKSNTGVLLYGNVGTGKSFLACCIANALIDKLVYCYVTSLVTLANRMFDENKEAVVSEFCKYPFVVIDDLGVECYSDYQCQQIYYLIDSRKKSGNPTIITTNLDMEQLRNESNLNKARIYDRILEMCPIQMKLTGKSKRVQSAEEKRNQARQILK